MITCVTTSSQKSVLEPASMNVHSEALEAEKLMELGAGDWYESKYTYLEAPLKTKISVWVCGTDKEEMCLTYQTTPCRAAGCPYSSMQ